MDLAKGKTTARAGLELDFLTGFGRCLCLGKEQWNIPEATLGFLIMPFWE